MSLKVPANGSTLWDELRDVLGPHIAPGHDSIDTINRLLRKSPWFPRPDAAIQIPRDNLGISEESWNLERLWPLIHQRQVTSSEPASTNGAVIVLRWNQLEHLMDGRRRINHWRRNNVVGPHRVLVVAKGNDI